MIQWSYIERIETKLTPPELDAFVALAQLEGFTMSELIRQALLHELCERYPGIYNWLYSADRRPDTRARLTEEIEKQLKLQEEQLAQGIPF